VGAYVTVDSVDLGNYFQYCCHTYPKTSSEKIWEVRRIFPNYKIYTSELTLLDPVYDPPQEPVDKASYRIFVVIHESDCYQHSFSETYWKDSKKTKFVGIDLDTPKLESAVQEIKEKLKIDNDELHYHLYYRLSSQ